jgi:YidC/Oxa1 family membrane protein insertase
MEGLFEAPAESVPARTIRVETDRYIAHFNSQGAGLSRFELKGLKSYYGETVVLVDEGVENMAASFNLNGRRVDTADLAFSTNAPESFYLHPGESRELVFSYLGQDGGRAELRYELNGDNHRMDAAFYLAGLSEPLRHTTWGIRWGSGLELTEQSAMQDNAYTEGLALTGSELNRYRLGSKEDAGETRFKGRVHWAASRNKYFEIALVPSDATAEEVYFRGVQSGAGSKDAHAAYAFEMELPLLDKKGIDQRFALYLGPLHGEELEVMDPSLGQSIMTKTSLGFMGFMWPLIRPFANLVLWVFAKLNLFISNYGVLIIVFSFLVKLVVWPLTHKSYQSMKEMQKIRPLQEEIKKKYGKNPQKMQEETMKLYREHKVNPLGGCLPNLLQMPLLFSLYFVFRGAFELRGASFVGWITDLSIPDSIMSLPFALPLYGDSVSLLAIIFAISSAIQMRMTLTDPNQKMMLYFMPVMMLLIFNQLPSGLTLYYTIFNLLSAAQQHYSKGMLENGNKVKPA